MRRWWRWECRIAGNWRDWRRLRAPDVGVITRVAVEHLEFFASIDEIALAERELIENLRMAEMRTAVLNADDERVARFAEVARGPRDLVRYFGARAEFRAENIEERGVEGSAFDFVSPAGRARLELPLIGRHNVMNALAALAAASVWGIGAEDAQRVFPTLQPADKRGEVVRFEDGFTVINDSYNSSPTALNALAELLAATPGLSRRILAAGEMLRAGRLRAGIAPRVRPHAAGAAARSTGSLACRAMQRKIRARGRRSGASAGAREIFREFGRSGEIPRGLHRARRSAAAEGFARREDGKNSRSDRRGPRTHAVRHAGAEHARGATEGAAAEMLYYLFFFVLRPHFSPLNVFRYITVRTAVASLTALAAFAAARALGDRAAARIAGEAIHSRRRAESAIRRKPARRRWAEC